MARRNGQQVSSMPILDPGSVVNSMDPRDGSCHFHISCSSMGGDEHTSSWIAFNYSSIHKPKTSTFPHAGSGIASSSATLGYFVTDSQRCYFMKSSLMGRKPIRHHTCHQQSSERP